MRLRTLLLPSDSSTCMDVPSAPTMLCLVASSTCSPLIARRTVFSLILASFRKCFVLQFEFSKFSPETFSKIIRTHSEQSCMSTFLNAV
jgi:hypothetical protein